MKVWGKIGWMLLGFFVIAGLLIGIGLLTGNVKMGRMGKKKEEESGDPTDTPMTTPTVPYY